MERNAKKKLKEQDIAVRAQQKELREFVLTRKDKVKEELVQPDEIVSLADYYNSPYMTIQGIHLWRGLKRSWQGYKIGKRLGESGDVFEKERQKECAIKIQEIQKLLRAEMDEFSVLTKEDEN